VIKRSFIERSDSALFRCAHTLRRSYYSAALRIFTTFIFARHYSLRSLFLCARSLRSLCIYRSARSVAALHRSLRYWSRRSYLRSSVAAHIHYVHICSLTIRCAHCSLVCTFAPLTYYQVRCAFAALMTAYLSRYARHFAVPMSLRSMSIARVSLLTRCAHCLVAMSLRSCNSTDASWRSCGASLRVLFLELRSAKNIPL
jgi:hypothetical protein